MFSPRWSPDGQSIAALNGSSSKIRIFHIATQTWSDLVDAKIAFPSWSHNGQFIYFLRTQPDTGIFRVRVNDGEIESVFALNGSHYTGYYGEWLGLDPNDNPLLLQDLGSDDIYALSLVTK